MNFNPSKKGGLSQSTQKATDTKYVLKKLSKYLMRFSLLIVLALLLTIASNLFGLVSPYLSGKAIGQIKSSGDVNFELLYYYLGLMLGFTVASALLSYFLSILMVYIAQQIVKKMRQDVFDKLMKLPISYFDKNQIGDILSKISYDIDTINTSLSSDVVMIISSVVTVIGSFVMMIITAPILVLIFLITIPLSIFFTRYFTKKAKKHFKERSRKLGELNGFVEEHFTGLKTIKAYSQEDNILADFDALNFDASEAAYMAEYYSSPVGPSVNFINNLSLALISIFGAILFVYSEVTGMDSGKISSFVLYSKKFSGPINEMANITAEIQSAMAAAERVFNVLDELEETKDDPNPLSLENIKGNVDAKNLMFGYTENKIILNNVSFTAPVSSTIAIVGPTGAGKTTIINLLMRFYELNGGAIYIDGNNIRNTKLTDLRQSYAMVLQETWLFTGTIYENILYGSKTATKEDVIRVCKMAHIHNYIEALPLGYDTIITEDGINISKGQKQLLTIARAMLLDAKMLIFDEATSNVDTKTEQEIQASMLELMKNKTCFIIAHRLSTIINADLILVVKKGNIIEQGTHEELLALKGFYYELYNSQY